jgi:hypothetical protein
MVRQKQICDLSNGSLHYEVRFTALCDELISTELYDELNDLINYKILTSRWTSKTGCKPTELAKHVEEYADAITDLSLLYDILRAEGNCTDGKFMKGIKYAHDYLTNKQK